MSNCKGNIVWKTNQHKIIILVFYRYLKLLKALIAKTSRRANKSFDWLLRPEDDMQLTVINRCLVHKQLPHTKVDVDGVQGASSRPNL